MRGLFSHTLVADSESLAVIQIPIGDDNGTFANIYPQMVSILLKCYIYFLSFLLRCQLIY